MSINVEEILDDLFASEINVEISWLWYGRIDGRLRRRGIDVKLGDPLHGYAAIGKANRMADAAVWLKDRACQQYPDSEFPGNMAASSDGMPCCPPHPAGDPRAVDGRVSQPAPGLQGRGVKHPILGTHAPSTRSSGL
jgi:hypothetical protein